ncbi:MAG TPA: DUF3300 domain-containing protein [Silvibacterium sp.]|nr:DUF3300 domain-containing protein [Silvibacterium sp.]
MQRNSSKCLRNIAILLLVPLLPAMVFAQEGPYQGPDQGPPPPPDGYSNQYDPGQQYEQPYGQPEADYDQPQAGYGEQQPLGPDQLDQLVAPLALNPDPLVALMLAASTYPAQVQQADQWRQSQGNAPPDQIAYGANLQAWDPSVKALTAFPQVLAEMDQNIQWTAALGNAYYNQPQDVLQSVQMMRQRAESAGNLQNTPQQEVDYDQGNIQVMPANPQVVYVPAYNPWTSYGEPVSPYPGFSLVGAIGSFFNSSVGSSAVQFGLGSVVSAFGSTPWGLLSWGLNWLTNSVLFNNSDYYSNSNSVADWGLPYGGPRAYGHREYAAYHRGYGRDFGRGYGRNGYYGNRNYRASNYGYNRGRQGFYGDGQSYNRYGPNYRNGLFNRTPSPYGGRSGYNYNRSRQGYNRNPMGERSQAFNRGYGSGFADRSHPGSYRGSNPGSDARFAYRGNGFSFNNHSNSYRVNSYNSNRSHENYRAPASSFNQSRAYRGNSFANYGRSSRSGGFFGGGHNSFGHQQKFKAPKYKAPKMHGGGGGHHLFGGGHSHGGGGHSHGGGGHHGGHPR